jgi:hypothetical protein
MVERMSGLQSTVCLQCGEAGKMRSRRDGEDLKTLPSSSLDYLHHEHGVADD